MTEPILPPHFKIAKTKKGRRGSIFGNLTMKKEFYAHSKEGEPPEHWHRLEDHLKRVVEMAQKI